MIGIRVLTKEASGRMLPLTTTRMQQESAVSEAENDSATDTCACS